MKTRLNNPYVLLMLLGGIGSVLMGQAQTFKTLYNFTGGSDGASPRAGLAFSANTLYGTTTWGGSSKNGAVFKLNTDGTDFTDLYSFTTRVAPFYTNSDGDYPYSGLVLSSNTLYGTAVYGGGLSEGTLFSLNTDGSGFTNLHNFNYTDGATPFAGLILSENTLYGTTYNGGSAFSGTAFKVSMDGTGFTNLHNFSAFSDGLAPVSGLILSENRLYGTTDQGGGSGNGMVFALNTDGTGFSSLHSFTVLNNGANNDGASPQAPLILSGSTLYGTTLAGGSHRSGVVFKVNIDGTGFAILHSFTASSGFGLFPTNSDGARPQAGLILWGKTLYGTAGAGGVSGNGTVFAVNTDGNGFRTLHSFTSLNQNTNIDGAYPQGGLTLSGNTLYGTASSGGSWGYGTVFSISFTPQVTITPSASNIILTWPTNYAGFDYTGYTLQSTTNLGPSAIWTTNSSAPVVVNGQNTVANPISGTQQFFRLSQ